MNNNRNIFFVILAALVAIICLLVVLIWSDQARIAHLTGEVFYLTGRYEQAHEKYREALDLKCVAGGPFKCTDRPDIDFYFFCGPVRASAQLYAKKGSVADRIMFDSYWSDLKDVARKRNRPQEAEECVDDLPDAVKQKIPDISRKNPQTPAPSPTSVSSASPVATIFTPTPTLRPIPTLTPTLTLTPTPTPFPNRPCASSGYRLYGDPMLLHTKVDRAPSIDIPRVFGTNNAIVNWASNRNMIACLASSPDGRGMLSVDDQIELRVSRDGKIATWVFNFYDPVTTGIGQYSAQDITWMFSSGTNLVTIFLHDTQKSYYYAEPVWLVMWQSP